MVCECAYCAHVSYVGITWYVRQCQNWRQSNNLYKLSGGWSIQETDDDNYELIFKCYNLSEVQLYQGLYSLSGKTSYRQISWSLEAARLSVIMIVSHWNLTGISAALLPRCLSNFRAIQKVWTRISWLRDFTKSCGKTSYGLVNRGPGWNMRA